MQDVFMSSFPDTSHMSNRGATSTRFARGVANGGLHGLRTATSIVAASVEPVHDPEVVAGASSAYGRDACAESLCACRRHFAPARPAPPADPPDKENIMTTQWTPTSTALPNEDALVEFLLEDRESPLCGIYHQGRFESRWFFYPPPKVCRWRDLLKEVATREIPDAELIRNQRHCLMAVEHLAAAA
jgi:hypothetical protein